MSLNGNGKNGGSTQKSGKRNMPPDARKKQTGGHNSGRNQGGGKPSQPVIAHAPYNFVPFSRYIQTVERDTLPSHDVIDPTLKSGEIHLTMRAETPVFVSDGDKEKPAFFRTPGGTAAIPGSTVRGMTRANMKILGFGVMRPGEDLLDSSIFYRRVGNPGSDPMTKHYKTVLRIKSERAAGAGPNAKTAYITTPEQVKAGYLCNEGGKYCIYPTAGGVYYPVSRGKLREWGFALRPASIESAACQVKNGRLIKACPAGRGKNIPGMTPGGALMVTGSPVGKPNSLCVFPRMDRSSQPVTLDRDCVLAYRRDYEGRVNSLKADTKGNKYDPDFWALPEKGKSKPVFYCQYNGRLYFGMSRFLRIGHKYSVADGLPQEHKQAAASGALDLTDAILGYTAEDSSYRSRVSFGDLLLLGEVPAGKEVRKILANPKASWYTGYVSDGKTYSHDGFSLRGCKQYWIKPADTRTEGEKSNVASVMRPLPAGCEFRGVIRFRNLREEELGLLLWALELREGCFQTVGMGKPFGFGSMKLTIDSVLEFDPEQLYAAVAAQLPRPTPQETYRSYIRTYQDKLGTHKDELEDFFHMKEKTDLPVEKTAYMTLDGYRRAGKFLTIRELRKPGQKDL